MLTDTQRRLVADLESKHPRFMIWIVNTAMSGTIWCARMKHDHSARMRTLINTGTSDDLNRRMTELEAEIPVLTRQAGLPPVRFHDLRHGAATMLLAAGQPPKVVSEILGHSTVAFTMDVYEVVAEELAEAAAVAISAFVPRKARPEVAR